MALLSFSFTQTRCTIFDYYKKKKLFKLSLNLRHINLAIRSPGGTQDFGTQFKLHALFQKNALEILGDLHIDAHPTDMA